MHFLNNAIIFCAQLVASSYGQNFKNGTDIACAFRTYLLFENTLLIRDLFQFQPSLLPLAVDIDVQFLSCLSLTIISPRLI